MEAIATIEAIGGTLLLLVLASAWWRGRQDIARVAAGVYGILWGTCLVGLAFFSNERVGATAMPIAFVLGPALIGSGYGFIAFPQRSIFWKVLTAALVGLMAASVGLFGSAIFSLMRHPDLFLFGSSLLVWPAVVIIYLIILGKRKLAETAKNGAR